MDSIVRLNFFVLITVLTAAMPDSIVFAAESAPDSSERACEAPRTMNNERLGLVIRKLDPEVVGQPGFWRFTIANREVLVITDENANRMRIFTGVAEIKEIDNDRWIRIMQANFDSALDARYAIAQGVLWSAFLHPLSTLDERDFVSGIAQVVNLAATYGSTYSSGALTFGGGDSEALIKELQEKADSI